MWRLRLPFLKLLWAWQRTRRGWADSDLWDLDHYLFAILADALPAMMQSTGHPCLHSTDVTSEQHVQNRCLSCSCEAEWNAELAYTATLFHRLAEDNYWRLGEAWLEVQERDYREATAWLAKRIGNLWT